MTDPKPNDQTRPAPDKGKAVSAKSPTETDANASALDNPSDVSELTAEEQMALFEKDLKENDWGHRPC